MTPFHAKILTLVVAALCVAPQLIAGDVTMQERLYTEWFDGLNQRDLSSMESLYSPNAIIHGREGDLQGPQGIRHLVERWLEAIPDVEMTPLHVSSEEDVVVIHWRAEGTPLQPPIRGIEVHGRKVTWHGLVCFRTWDNQVVEQWAAVDYRSLSQ